MELRQLLDLVERALQRRRPRAMTHGAGRVLLQKALGLSRQTLWRYERRGAPPWLHAALLGVLVSAGDREAVERLLHLELDAD